MSIKYAEKIHTLSRSICYLCGNEGELLYAGLQDGLFGVPGKWNFRRCSNQECRLVWLDPYPSENDIGKAYATYFTHSKNKTERFHWLRYVVSKTFWSAFDFLMHSTDLRRERFKLSSMYLTDVMPGKLLEVGCGNGYFLDQMRSKGWEVEGIEVDSQAANAAKTTFKVNVHMGKLEEAMYPCASFDAIAMNHVIEHIHDPIALLKECHRILKPRGWLVATTPNIKSLGHMRFGQNWMGLDAPRHLHLFSTTNITSVAKRAGFSEIRVWTTPARAYAFALGSLGIQLAREHRKKDVFNYFTKGFKSAIFQTMALSHWQRDQKSGEEIVLLARG